MTLVILLLVAALIAPPIIIRAHRQWRGPAVLRWDSSAGRWVATYRRLR